MFFRQELLRMSDSMGFARQGLGSWGLQGWVLGGAAGRFPHVPGSQEQPLHGGSQGDPWGSRDPPAAPGGAQGRAGGSEEAPTP